jgi:O-antigen/teichoic acid export membrane protein
MNLILNFILIPKYGAFGAAFTTMITQIFAGGAQMVRVVQRFRFGINSRLLFQFLLYGLTLFSINQFVLESYVENETYRFFFSGFIAAIALVATGLLSVRNISKLLKQTD